MPWDDCAFAEKAGGMILCLLVGEGCLDVVDDCPMGWSFDDARWGEKRSRSDSPDDCEED